MSALAWLFIGGLVFSFGWRERRATIATVVVVVAVTVLLLALGVR